MKITIAPCVARAWPGIEVDGAPFGSGLINATTLASIGEEKVVLQRVHPAFKGIVNDDIDAVTSRLAERKVLTPRIVRTSEGHTWVDDDEGLAWRVLTYVDGRSFDKISSPAMAEQAGALVARYHTALDGFSHQYLHVRPGVHDTRGHLARLERALDAHRAHRLYDDVARLAETLLRSGASLLPVDATPPRHAHGDLKASNLLFDPSDRGVCLVDLDTVAKMIWPFEIGDALRSWCNPSGENVDMIEVDEAILEGAMRGYFRGSIDAPPSREETSLAVMGLFTIATELATRFLADALVEQYFGFDASRFPARGEHNLLRARGQASLAENVIARRSELEAIVERIA